MDKRGGGGDKTGMSLKGEGAGGTNSLLNRVHQERCAQRIDKGIKVGNAMKSALNVLIVSRWGVQGAMEWGQLAFAFLKKPPFFPPLFWGLFCVGCEVWMERMALV